MVLRQRDCHFARRARSSEQPPLLPVAACAPMAIPARHGCTYGAHALSLFWCAYYSPRHASSLSLESEPSHEDIAAFLYQTSLYWPANVASQVW